MSSLEDFKPYPKQREWFNLRRSNKALFGATQVGVTTAGAYEVACHLVGWYPRWWKGHTFTYPPRTLFIGANREQVRDTMQRRVVGCRKEAGLIQQRHVADHTWRNGVPNAFDAVLVQHRIGVSSISFQPDPNLLDRTIFDLIWIDADCADRTWQMIQYNQMPRARVLATLTPLRGMSPIVQFFEHGPENGCVVHMAWADAPHMAPALRDFIKNNLPAMEHAPRLEGKPHKEKS